MIEKWYAEQVFQQWHCNNHVGKTNQVIAVVQRPLEASTQTSQKQRPQDIESVI
jgi:hypothetical protein